MTAPVPANPTFGVGLTTVGRWAELSLLLEDLAGQTRPPDAVAIAHHDGSGTTPEGLDALLQRFGGLLPITVLVSPRGVSNGRNLTAEALGDEVEWLWFPNDTSRIDPDFFERVAGHCTPDRTVVALQLVDREGPRNPLPAPGSPLTRRNAWGAIEPATLFRRRQFLAVGGFDTNRGSGSDGPWQAGEGTDLILRLSEADGFSIDWVGDIVVHAQTEFAHLPPEERRRKLRNYGRGAGNILRTWRYPLWYKLAHLLAAVLMPIRKPEKFGTRDALALLIGRTEGVLGRPFGARGDHQAILR
ncbi:glycosyltransferase [Mycolicibacterium sp. S2-37]|uniref:glycosyltransferase family 2 protein n=1 Tax=Mycolicibacterium sp. S2-37 TaxID=2810297 RepID=UPI001A94DDF7|nr:glycosyltransferase [Mycolicibacterium sp. S2-37]MBO0681407.1 glycosyltransferase [Mycolicibacterium sp. S2-37]